ncbi:MAG TPA: glutaredoxin family protein [Candidatus Hydrogenedentes bacterium]|nr:glutaredoxin family protein [Candidatus Hydrogenedentota bacterium]HIB54154.1 glutaredoxin family protein [Nitrospirales bacterium]|tara:strand:- start:130 stop:381 length:252 start_codon:yes stop_codon:yes gene_type:complete
MSREIFLYSAKMCGDCQHLKAYMDAEGIEYTLKDIRENPADGEELEQKTGKLGVPYLVIDGEWIRGYDVGKAFSQEFADNLFA